MLYFFILEDIMVVEGVAGTTLLVDLGQWYGRMQAWYCPAQKLGWQQQRSRETELTQCHCE